MPTCSSAANSRLYLYFGIIALLVFIVYEPSFSFYFAGLDVYKYFIETRGASLLELLTKYGSYAAVSNYAKGDMLTFRPLFFAFLGLQKALFKSSYLLWQLAAIITHLAVVLSLYRLLMKIKPGIFAWLLSAIFAVYALFMRLVTWTAINSYFLYVAIVLTAVYHLYEYSINEKMTRHHLLWIFFCMLVASFFYETGFIFCAFFAAYLAVRDYSRGKAGNKRDFGYLILLIPVFVYLVLYLFNEYYSKDWIMVFETKKIFNYQNITDSLLMLPRMFLIWIKGGFFLDSTYAGGRLTSSAISFQLRYALLILACLYSAFGLAISFDWLKRNRLFIGLLAIMLVSHLGINCVGRIGTHGFDYLVNTKQSAYMFWAYFLILVYAAVDFERLKAYSRHLWSIGIAGAWIFILFNAAMTYRLNVIFKEERRPMKTYMDQVGRFVKAHSKEKNFSFMVVPTPPWVAAMIEGYEDPKHKVVKKGTPREFPLAEVFYGEFYNTTNPKYVLRYDAVKNEIR